VNSCPGRTELAEVGQLRPQPGRAAEPEHGDMRQPRAALPLVHTEPLEAFEDVERERPRVATQVLEDDHPDAPRLAVALYAEPDRPGGRCGGTELGADPID